MCTHARLVEAFAHFGEAMDVMTFSIGPVTNSEALAELIMGVCVARCFWLGDLSYYGSHHSMM